MCFGPNRVAGAKAGGRGRPSSRSTCSPDGGPRGPRVGQRPPHRTSQIRPRLRCPGVRGHEGGGGPAELARGGAGRGRGGAGGGRHVKKM